MKDFYSLTHASCDYKISLDLLANRKKDPYDARVHIDTDQILLPNGKKVSEYKKDFQEYELSGGTDKRKVFLDNIAQRDFGETWDQTIKSAKARLIRTFNFLQGRLSPNFLSPLEYVANQGHAEAAYVLGRHFMDCGDDRAVEWLIKSHNFGHSGALFALSGYLALKTNHIGAIICLVIAADKGNETAQLSILHSEKIGYMRDADPKQLVETLNNLSTTTPYSTARHLQLIRLALTGEDLAAFKLLESLISRPLNPPRKRDTDVYYKKRVEHLQSYFTKLRDELRGCTGQAVALNERMAVFQRLSREFTFSSFNDFLELESFIHKASQNHQ